MKKALSIFFTTLGVIFFCIILAGIYFFITDPYNLRPMLSAMMDNSTSTSTVSDKNPMLSEKQEKTLETFGIDPATVPSSITPEQEACFEAKLGEKRVAEIKAGDTPTAAEFFKAKDCV